MCELRAARGGGGGGDAGGGTQRTLTWLPRLVTKPLCTMRLLGSPMAAPAGSRRQAAARPGCRRGARGRPLAAGGAAVGAARARAGALGGGCGWAQPDCRCRQTTPPTPGEDWPAVGGAGGQGAGDDDDESMRDEGAARECRARGGEPRRGPQQKRTGCDADADAAAAQPTTTHTRPGAGRRGWRRMCELSLIRCGRWHEATPFLFFVCGAVCGCAAAQEEKLGFL